MGRRKSGLERIVGGLTSGAVIWGLWYFHLLPGAVLVVLGVLFGVFPVLSGIRRVVKEIEDRRQQKYEALEGRRTQELERQDSLEKTVLKIAKKRGGVVSAALVVLESDLKLNEAEKVLESLAARGYAEMRVKENGSIDFRFHDLT